MGSRQCTSLYHVVVFLKAKKCFSYALGLSRNITVGIVVGFRSFTVHLRDAWLWLWDAQLIIKALAGICCSQNKSSQNKYHKPLLSQADLKTLSKCQEYVCQHFQPANIATKACNASAIPKTFKNCTFELQVTLFCKSFLGICSHHKNKHFG